MFFCLSYRKLTGQETGTDFRHQLFISIGLCSKSSSLLPIQSALYSCRMGQFMECRRGIGILGMKLLAVRKIDPVFYRTVKCLVTFVIRNRNSHAPRNGIHQFYWLYFILCYFQLGDSYNHIPIVNRIHSAKKLIPIIDLSTSFPKFLPADCLFLLPIIGIPIFNPAALAFPWFQFPSLLFDLCKCTPSVILISFLYGCQQ